MICCFMNFHEQESAKDLIAHFDREIDIAIGRGCSVFLTGTKYPEEEIKLIKIEESDETLKNRFIAIADWEIYAYS